MLTSGAEGALVYQAPGPMIHNTIEAASCIAHNYNYAVLRMALHHMRGQIYIKQPFDPYVWIEFGPIDRIPSLIEGNTA